jgi:hypothetical protein
MTKILKILILTILNIHFHAKTQRKTSNLSITSCKSSNPGNPDSDNIEYSVSRKDAKENQQFINNIL